MIGHITYLSEESMHQKFGRRCRTARRFGYEFETEFEVESYLQYKGNRFTQRFDANSYLYVTKALDYFDLSVPAGLAAAFAHSEHIKFLVVSFTSDWLYPVVSQQGARQRADRGGRRRDLSRHREHAGATMPSCWRSTR